ncbi:MAG: DUF1592 domain-containing protein [Myxococcota bacterium]
MVSGSGRIFAPRLHVLALLMATASFGCTGTFDASDSPAGQNPDVGGPGPGPGGAALVGPEPIRRLTRTELQHTLEDALGVTVADRVWNSFPDDARTPFDNDVSNQSISNSLFLGVRQLASSIASQVESQPELLVSCDLGEAGCLRDAASTTGARILRRPLRDEEVTELVAVAAPFDGRARLGLIVEALLLDPEFLFRIERGPVTNGAQQLDGSSIANRLSMLLWGSGPDDTLLARGGSDDLRDPGVRLEEARRMLADPRAARQMDRFFGLWLGYESTIPPGDLGNDLRRESAELVRRVVLDEQLPLAEIFRFPETFVTPQLADHYGLPPVDEPSWVSYSSPVRAGILSHGSYLSTGSPSGPTSVTFRGQNVLERLLCAGLPTPTEDVVDEPPGMGECKEDIWNMATVDGCKSCHILMDGIGTGLEQYGSLGQFREEQPGRPGCRTQETGTLPGGSEAFSGPGALGRAVAENEGLLECFVVQVSRFALGKADLHEAPAQLIEARDAFLENPTVTQLLEAIVQSDSFIVREVPQ